MYLPIADHGIIGDLNTAALVGIDGTVDWFCAPHFDSPSVFASILDAKRGGHFRLQPSSRDFKASQRYLPETNVLTTRFTTEEGVAEVADFMPIRLDENQDAHHVLVRRITGIRGNLNLRIDCSPRFNYGRDIHTTQVSGNSVIFQSPSQILEYWSTLQPRVKDGVVSQEFALSEGHSEYIALDALGRHEVPEEHRRKRFDLLYEETIQYWHRWVGQCTYTGRWRETVLRSALVLKLLTYEPTGAFVAAPTTSLPEHIGGVRNWDYRYTWIRDAAFSVYGLMRMGFTEEAGRFMSWLEERCAEIEPGEALQIMYSITGKSELKEEEISHLSGYQDSRPVRIGNGAFDQLQLDIYGELMDAVYLLNKYHSPISYDFWSRLRRLINWLADNWQSPDEGIWETRGGRDHFVYSKLMCWVAFDRAIRLAEKRSFPSEKELWIKLRDRIYEEIMERGWNDEIKAFTQTYDGKTLDAANLLMPLVFFMSPTDPRMLSTIDAIKRPTTDGGLVASNLVYRYNAAETSDGLAGEEGAFSMCTFWLVEALTRAGRIHRARLQEARLIFEQMMGHANHLGLYSEEIGASGEHLGNFPQAFTHLSLISAAFNLDRALESRN